MESSATNSLDHSSKLNFYDVAIEGNVGKWLKNQESMDSGRLWGLNEDLEDLDSERAILASSLEKMNKNNSSAIKPNGRNEIVIH